MKPRKASRFEFLAAIPEIVVAYAIVYGLPAITLGEEKHEQTPPPKEKIVVYSPPLAVMHLQVCEKQKNEYDA